MEILGKKPIGMIALFYASDVNYQKGGPFYYIMGLDRIGQPIVISPPNRTDQGIPMARLEGSRREIYLTFSGGGQFLEGFTP